MTKNNIDSLDGLRAFACFLVVFSHLAKEEMIPDIRGAGQLGVMLFFVLSGFLMSHLYATRAITGSLLLDYAFKRIFRVLPAYVCVLFIAYYLAPHWDASPYPIDLPALIEHMKLRGDASVFWTIPVEMKFYLFFTLIWFALSFLQNTTHKSIVMFVALIFTIYYCPLDGALRLDLSRSIAFFMGGVSAGLIHQHVFIEKRWQQNFINISSVCTLFLTFLFIPQIFVRLIGVNHPMWHFDQILTPLFSACVFFAANASGYAKALFSNNLAMFLGKISFSLYLVHLPVIIWINQMSVFQALPVFLKILVAILLSILISYVLYRIIENPFRKFGMVLRGVIQNKI